MFTPRDEKRERDPGSSGLLFTLNVLFLTGGRVPKDGVTIDERLSQDAVGTTIIFYVLSCFGMLFCLCCLLLNVIYRKHM